MDSAECFNEVDGSEELRKATLADCDEIDEERSCGRRATKQTNSRLAK